MEATSPIDPMEAQTRTSSPWAGKMDRPRLWRYVDQAAAPALENGKDISTRERMRTGGVMKGERAERRSGSDVWCSCASTSPASAVSPT